MNKNSLIGILLIVAILVGYSLWMAPSKEEIAQRQHVADSIAVVNQQKARAEADRVAAEQSQRQQIDQQNAAESFQNNSEADYTTKHNTYGVFASTVNGEDKTWTIENDLIKLTFYNKGGFIHRVELKDYVTWDTLPLVLFDPETADFNLSFALNDNRPFNSNIHYFVPYLNGIPYEGESSIMTPTNDSLVFSMRLFADNADGSLNPNAYLEYIYTIQPNDYMIGFDIKTVGLYSLVSNYTNYMTIDWYADILKQERKVDRYNGSTIYFKSYSDDVESMDEVKDETEEIKTRVKWVSFKQRFFSNALIADSFFDNAELTTSTNKNAKNPHYLKTMHANLEFEYRDATDEKVIPMAFFFGPNQFKTLNSYNLKLERQIPLGGWGISWINRYIVIPVFNWLGSYGWNYGIVILILTILLKILLMPVAYKTYISSAKMRVLKPEVDVINERYPKEEDGMKKQQAIMTLYRQAGASPTSGCLPMLLQMPILFALFRFFPSSIELRQQSFLWAQDLSSYDSILNLPFTIPFYGDHVSLFCLLMTISTIFYTYINNKMMSGAQNQQQMKSMKIMMYVMPIMFLGIFNDYAAGLSYYYLLVNLISFLQMYLFRLFINEDRLRKKIELSKKKPIKKSGFQKRLEEAQKNALKQQQAQKR